MRKENSILCSCRRVGLASLAAPLRGAHQTYGQGREKASSLASAPSEEASAAHVRGGLSAHPCWPSEPEFAAQKTAVKALARLSRCVLQPSVSSVLALHRGQLPVRA